MLTLEKPLPGAMGKVWRVHHSERWKMTRMDGLNGKADRNRGRGGALKMGACR